MTTKYFELLTQECRGSSISGLLKKGSGPRARPEGWTGAPCEQLVKQKRHMGTVNQRKKAKFRRQHVRPAKREQARCGIQGHQSRLRES